MASTAGRVAQTATRQVKPILSLDRDEARKRALNLYKAWYRQIPYIVFEYHLPLTTKQGREKLRSEFVKNRHVTDVRALDMLVVKGQMELVETINKFKQPSHVMAYFREATVEEKPKEFLDKFLSGR